MTGAGTASGGVQAEPGAPHSEEALAAAAPADDTLNLHVRNGGKAPLVREGDVVVIPCGDQAVQAHGESCGERPAVALSQRYSSDG